ncbi:NAD(P)/FAD-dependent oxidoreductase [Streptomyces sp. NPDC020965]|uniref:NAD(P)/FAD-dependent oxidoreductase n=1 Tax=Streptomyces sp. NPDC020965 TaxID=3365105 RepID=UPI00379982FF
MTNRPKPKKSAKQQVTVVGAGYAGLLAALRLAPHAQVTLIDPSDRFTERVRLHERAAHPREVTHPLRDLLCGTGVRHLPRRATTLDPIARLVTTDDGQHLAYDRLVYALGSRTALANPTTDRTAGTADERVYTAESTDRLRQRMRDGTGSVAVVGGGLTGIELAAELAEAHPRWTVRLLSAGPVAAGHSARGRAHVLAVLTALGVQVDEGHRIADPAAVDADAVVWAASMVPNTSLAADAGLPLDPRTGRITVDDTLRSIAHPEIYAVGDAAAAHSPLAGPMRMGCAAALPTGAAAATSIIAETRGQAPKPLSFGYVIQCVSLGRHDGLIQLVRPDDTPRDRILTGRRAAFIKERVVRSTVLTLRLARRHPTAIPFLPGLG